MWLRLYTRTAFCGKLVKIRHVSGRVQVGLASVFSVDLLKPEDVAGLQGFVVLSPDAFGDKNMLPKLLHSMVASAAEGTDLQSSDTSLVATDSSRSTSAPPKRKHVNMIVPAARVEELFKQLGLDASSVIAPMLSGYVATAPLTIEPPTASDPAQDGALVAVNDASALSSVAGTSSLPALPLGRLLSPPSSSPTTTHLSSVHLGNGLSHVTRVATQASAIHVPILPGHGSSVAELNQEEQLSTRSKGKGKEGDSTREDVRKQLLNAARECDVVKLALLLDGNTGGQLETHDLLEGLIDEETGASPLHALVTSVHAHDSADDCVAGINLLLSNGNDVNARAGTQHTHRPHILHITLIYNTTLLQGMGQRRCIGQQVPAI
jgi:hypothetical protein